jgi:Flp pilus assembly protein TadD
VQANNLAAATAEFERLVQRQPKSVANSTALGLLYHLQGNLDQAKSAYERALALNPVAPVAANNLAQLLADRNENLDTALQLAQTAKAGLPNTHAVSDTLGWVLYRKGLSAQAIAAFQEAIKADPKNPGYQYRLGLAYLQANDKPAARQALQKALSLGDFPQAPDAKRALDGIK